MISLHNQSTFPTFWPLSPFDGLSPTYCHAYPLGLVITSDITDSPIISISGTSPSDHHWDSPSLVLFATCHSCSLTLSPPQDLQFTLNFFPQSWSLSFSYRAHIPWPIVRLIPWCIFSGPLPLSHFITFVWQHQHFGQIEVFAFSVFVPVQLNMAGEMNITVLTGVTVSS